MLPNCHFNITAFERPHPKRKQHETTEPDEINESGTGLAIRCNSMSTVSPVPAYSPAQQTVLGTPSPFTFSVASTRWSSRPAIHLSSIFLRSMALVLSFASALALAAPSPERKAGKSELSFHEYPELMYSFAVNSLIFLYSAYQLFKGVCDLAYRGILVSDMISDYISFILDQLAAYLLASCSSLAILAIQKLGERQSYTLWKASIVSVSISFAAFLVIAACALISGYKLCKRIIW